jgi:DNA-binding NarL/FixJ family response regulator
MHILIANNSPSFRKEAREMIETIPFVSIVEEAKSGKEAIEFVKKHHPDVVLMDIVMSGMSGIEATRLVKEISPETKVIVITAYDNEEFQKQSIEAGADFFLRKEELNPDTLMECFKNDQIPMNNDQ